MSAMINECGPDCAAFVQRWDSFWAQKIEEPVALLECGPDYLPGLSASARNMVTKARRLYDFRSFVYNDHLAGIDEVNRSKPQRQGRPMTGWYTRPAQPTNPARLCEVHRDEWIGGFDALDQLAGYAHVEILDGLAIINSILGTGSGVVNGLLAYLAERPDIEWVNYLQLESSSEGLTAFKRRCGFFSAQIMPSGALSNLAANAAA